MFIKILSKLDVKPYLVLSCMCIGFLGFSRVSVCHVVKVNDVQKTDQKNKLSKIKLSKIKLSEVNKLRSLLQKNNKFQATFIQTNSAQPGVASAGNSKSSGIIKIQQPLNFYYQIKQPHSILYVSDGKTLWQYDDLLEQVIKKDLDLKASGIPLLLLASGGEEIQKFYDVSQTSPDVFLLNTLDKESFITQVKITFKQDAIYSFDVINSMGQRTEVVFSDLDLVKSFKKGSFKFEVPYGVDVLT